MMKTLPIIGLLGRARSGKDTVASIILSNYTDYRLVRLAQPMKEAASCLFGFTHDQLETDAKEQVDPRYGVTPRSVMVWLTRTTTEQMGKDFFFYRAMVLHADKPFKVIPDVRFSWDAEKIREMGGIIVKLERPASSVHHSFEDMVDEVVPDYLIRNDRDILSLEAQVHRIMSKISETGPCHGQPFLQQTIGHH